MADGGSDFLESPKEDVQLPEGQREERGEEEEEDGMKSASNRLTPNLGEPDIALPSTDGDESPGKPPVRPKTVHEAPKPRAPPKPHLRRPSPIGPNEEPPPPIRSVPEPPPRQYALSWVKMAADKTGPVSGVEDVPLNEIKNCIKLFKSYDKNSDKRLDLDELKQMMERIGHPQTHLELKSMMNDVDEDKDNQINFEEFLRILRKVRSDDHPKGSSQFGEMNAVAVGVRKAKDFFESKISDLQRDVEMADDARRELSEKANSKRDKKRKMEAFKSIMKVFQQIEPDRDAPEQ